MDIVSIKDRFKKYRNDLWVICSNGYTHLFLFKKLFKYFSTNKDVFMLSPTFFAFSRDGHLECGISNLMRLFDTHQDSYSIFAYINYIKSNMKYLFAENKIGEVKRVIKEHRQLLLEIEGKLKILKTWRDKRLFHLDKEYLGDLNKIFRDYRLNIEDIENLYKIASDILNQYSILFDNQSFYMLPPRIHIEFNDLINQLKLGKTDGIIEKLKILGRLKDLY